jgi:hypothetical protein
MDASLAQHRNYIGFITAFIGLLISLGGCAGVTFYSDPELTHKTGLKYYIAKPYLLVTRNATKDTPLKVEVIQLPDLENPNYGVYKPGWGTHEFALKVSNGILTEYNQKADSKGPETISALADLASKAGGGFSSVATGLGALQKQAANVPKAIAAIHLAMGNLRSAASELPTGSKEAKGLMAASDALEKVASEITPENTTKETDTLREIQNSIDAITIDPSIPSVAKIKAEIHTAQARIGDAITALATTVQTVETPPASYELYEIQMENGETRLIPVKISKSMLKVILQYGQHAK